MTAVKCRCGHLRDLHGLDRKHRPTCFGSTVCACTTYRLPEPTPTTPRFDERYDPSPEPIQRRIS